MPLHLIKLAVGCESVKELKGWVAERMATAKKKGLPIRHIHVTRMTPKRDGELLAGGSLYWVIKGEIAAREKIIAIEPFRDKDGIGRCRLVMQPKVFAVSPRPMRPFQGWRYLTEDAAPPDLTKSSAASEDLLVALRRHPRDVDVAERKPLLFCGCHAFGNPAFEFLDRLAADGKLDEVKRHDHADVAGRARFEKFEKITPCGDHCSFSEAA